MPRAPLRAGRPRFRARRCSSAACSTAQVSGTTRGAQPRARPPRATGRAVPARRRGRRRAARARRARLRAGSPTRGRAAPPARSAATAPVSPTSSRVSRSGNSAREKSENPVTTTAGSDPRSTTPHTRATVPDDASRRSPQARAPNPSAAAAVCHATSPRPPPRACHAPQNRSSAPAGTSCHPLVAAVANSIDPGRCPWAIREPSGTSQSASAPITPREAASAAAAATGRTIVRLGAGWARWTSASSSGVLRRGGSTLRLTRWYVGAARRLKVSRSGNAVTYATRRGAHARDSVGERGKGEMSSEVWRRLRPAVAALAACTLLTLVAPAPSGAGGRSQLTLTALEPSTVQSIKRSASPTASPRSRSAPRSSARRPSTASRWSRAATSATSRPGRGHPSARHVLPAGPLPLLLGRREPPLDPGPGDRRPVVARWMKSPEHRMNLLNPAWREFAVAALRARQAPVSTPARRSRSSPSTSASGADAGRLGRGRPYLRSRGRRRGGGRRCRRGCPRRSCGRGRRRSSCSFDEAGKPVAGSS